MRNKLTWPTVAVICSAIIASGIYLKLKDNRTRQTTQIEWGHDDPVVAEPPEGFVLDEPDRAPSFQEINKKNGPETGQRQDQESQFLKSVINNELSDLSIAKPDIDALLQKAKENSASAQYDLGKVYFIGSWLPKNEPLALNLFLKSAQQGNTDAMRSLYSYIVGTLLSIDISRSFLHKQNDISQGQSDRLNDAVRLLAACNEKAFVPRYLNSIQDPKDGIDRLDSGRRTANLQSFPVTEENQANVATDKQHVNTIESLWNRAKEGDIDALFSLGGGIPDSLERLQFLMRAAELGHIEAQFKCGFLRWYRGFTMYDRLLNQKTPEQHLNEAKKWYTQAAQNGHTEAQCQLARIELESGNYQAALIWYTKAAKSGSEEATRGIMSIMSKHEAIETACLEALSTVVESQRDFQDITLYSIALKLALARTNNAKYCKQAVELFEKLGEDDKYGSCRDLGGIYSQKKGCVCEGFVEKDIEKAIYWYSKGNDEESLASLYFEEKEYDKSFPIFKRLAEKERDKSTIYSYWGLGYSYFMGFGTVKNYYQAYKWLLIYNKYKPDYHLGFVEEKLSVEMIGQAQREAAQLAKAIDAYYDNWRKKAAAEEREQQANAIDHSFMEWHYSEWREDMDTVSKLLAQALPNANIPTSYDWIGADGKK